ncbi:putative tetratricopeptide-like helical domain superfamily [Arabidopsis thaliana]|uniref:Uncharacterized protein n=4 Tax=Arabidopsis TaxID=3701 RepID=F4JZA9_ARATH|nr:uncharacterized protein AT5G05360 [Arabidopsis thaliana]KAG7601254.1 hypothetical protein ISN45_At05g004510 [Arabidopsis thaliana x Arabidopsis arenosa]AED90864.1 hypothetical protein AT5G05360 [Arabidopsis thaliana]OAO93905.1 hypothetical protein AXX17_AT5G04840 [Arabidopsis thaliana]CAA0400809.1 unnamed protein product [Arabidopsis thaliana]CAD5330883.1 unnamed protein product [Arabidopsis thaliana]|eukprot:NP_196155.2 hypothetical protein AT5G05360 [Arabidopsis thaliana]
MGKSMVRFAEFAIRLSSENPTRPHRPSPSPRNKVFVKKTTRDTTSHLDYSNLVKLEKAGSHSGSNPAPASGSDPINRVPLAQVVEDCVRRWFQDTLKEAKSGDVGMQVLVGQMYCSGYGIPKDENKGRAWINKASRTRSSAWQVSDKPPGYNASDSDSNDKKD